ncbi:ABC transporter permease [Fulvivirgaceae bacterium BMA12]|uniref:ABC transporter permease n=1 Tax=Agaribacillus aureus TaxID=3051825 RepID=A0ABT8L2U9_9BACT|nr:ABC transporter permease [Fulvivirgaceae bacterium BMA12]
MVNSNKSNQPQWPGWILKRLCNPHYLEEIQGDLYEAYEDRLKVHKPQVARWLYFLDVLGFLRYSLIKSFTSPYNFIRIHMLYNHLKIALRIFSKNKLFSLINVVGLTIGITAYVLITQYVKFESGYDKYHPGIDDLYRVTLTWNFGSKGFHTDATNHPAVASSMKADFPEVENYARVVDKTVMWGTFVLSYTNENGIVVKSNANDNKMFIAEGSIFELFDIPLVHGNPATALKEPLSVVMSESLARQFFGEEDPLGKTLMVNNEQPVKVTGVFKDLPQNTHLNFDILASFSTLGDWTDNTWIWPEFYNYVRLRPGTDPAEVEAKFPAFVKKYLGDVMKEHGFEASFGLQPVKDIHLKSQLNNEISANSSDQTLRFLMIIAGFVIVIALINFINLSTAKSVERAKEVGLRKVVGGRRGALIGQFLMESLLINLISVVLAVGLISLLMKPFNELVGLDVLSLSLWLDPNIWLTLLLVFLAGGLLAGIYPALVLSGFKPVYVLKGKFHKTGSGALLRRILVITQFIVSIGLIAGTFILYKQFTFMQSQELGYDVEHSMVVNAPIVTDSTITSKIEVFKNELLRNPNINAVAASSAIPGKRIIWTNGTRKLHDEKEMSVSCYQLTIDHDFLPTYKIALLAGRNFTKADRSPYFNPQVDSRQSHKVLVNRAAVKKLGYTGIEEVLNEKIIFKLGPKDRTGEVIGVVDDYHQQSLQHNIDPIIFIYPDNYFAMYLTFNVNTTNLKETIEAVEAQFNDFFPHDPYKYFFLDEYFNRQYQADNQFAKICFWFSGLAIFIAVLGLFGLGSYMALQRTKEISVRKVLGANTMQMLILIPKDLLKLILIASVIALPAAYLVTQEWLSGYAFQVDLSLWMFILPLGMVILVAFVSVLFQSLKAAMVNPADSLRNE